MILSTMILFLTAKTPSAPSFTEVVSPQAETSILLALATLASWRLDKLVRFWKRAWTADEVQEK